MASLPRIFLYRQRFSCHLPLCFTSSHWLRSQVLLTPASSCIWAMQVVSQAASHRGDRGLFVLSRPPICPFYSLFSAMHGSLQRSIWRMTHQPSSTHPSLLMLSKDSRGPAKTIVWNRGRRVTVNMNGYNWAEGLWPSGLTNSLLSILQLQVYVKLIQSY